MIKSVTQQPIPGGWVEREVRIRDRPFQLIMPSSPDQLLDELDCNGPPLLSDVRDPYWAALWPAATPFAEAVLEGEFLPGTAAVELGCGIGLAGIAALAKGLHVTFNDQIELAVAVAMENAKRNGFRHCQGAVFDWHTHPDKRFPIILASDVLYERNLHQPLVDALLNMLSQDGTCWIGDPGRNHVDAFLNRACEAGLVAELRGNDGNPLRRPHHGQFQLIRLRRGLLVSRQAARPA